MPEQEHDAESESDSNQDEENTDLKRKRACINEAADEEEMESGGESEDLVQGRGNGGRVMAEEIGGEPEGEEAEEGEEEDVEDKQEVEEEKHKLGEKQVIKNNEYIYMKVAILVAMMTRMLEIAFRDLNRI